MFALLAMPFTRNAIVFDAEPKTIAELAERIKKDQTTAFDAVKAIADEALGKAKAGEGVSEAIKQKADEALTKLGVLTTQLGEVEQKLERQSKGDPDKPKTIGEKFAADEKVKSWIESKPRSGQVSIKANTLTSDSSNTAGAVGDAIFPTILPGIYPIAQRKLTVRDLISPGQMGGNTLEYVKETGFNNNAGMVAEGASKPQSDVKLDLVTTSAKVIAHWMKASKQVLDDIPALRSMIDQRLIYGLKYVEDGQLLNGDGTGQNLLGIIPQATAYAPPITITDTNMIDVMRFAMLQASLALYPATGHVMHPSDWAQIETMKDGQGRYLIGNPQGQLTPTLWGLPVVETQSMTVRKFLTGAFKLGAQLFDRWEASVEVGFVNDDFIKNLVTILGEERLALAVYRPEAFIYGDFDTALGL